MTGVSGRGGRTTRAGFLAAAGLVDFTGLTVCPCTQGRNSGNCGSGDAPWTGVIRLVASTATTVRRHFFFKPTLLPRFEIFRLVVTLVTVPMARYFCFTVSRMASRWS